MATIPIEQISTSNLDAGMVSAPAPAEPASGPLTQPALAQEGMGTDGEIQVWEAGYAMRAFAVETILWGVISLGWASPCHLHLGSEGTSTGRRLTIISGIVLGIAWLLLLRRMASARLGHHYRLTDRRLFVSTGFLSRRRDQIELLRVQDVYTRQSLAQRWFSVGTVIVVSSEAHLPLVHLTGIADPKAIMDLIWHHARKERDKRSVKVDQLA